MSCQCSPESGPAESEDEQSPFLHCGQGCPAWAVPLGQCSQIYTVARGQMPQHLLKSCFLKLICVSEGKSCCAIGYPGTCQMGVVSWALAYIMSCQWVSPAAPGLELARGLASDKYPAKAYQYLSPSISKGNGFLLSHAHRSCPISRKLPKGEIVKMLRKEERINKLWISDKSLERYKVPLSHLL